MHATRDEVLANLSVIRGSIDDACARAGRDRGEVTLVAAAKTVPSEVVAWVAEAGVTAVGHNYVQELRSMHDEVAGVRWHFIGTLQASSAHHVAALADVVETVAGEKATARLARRAHAAGREIDALIEVDLTGERSGVSPGELPEPDEPWTRVLGPLRDRRQGHQSTQRDALQARHEVGEGREILR